MIHMLLVFVYNPRIQVTYILIYVKFHPFLGPAQYCPRTRGTPRYFMGMPFHKSYKASYGVIQAPAVVLTHVQSTEDTSITRICCSHGTRTKVTGLAI